MLQPKLTLLRGYKSLVNNPNGIRRHIQHIPACAIEFFGKARGPEVSDNPQLFNGCFMKPIYLG
jgi:hypothetical protein